MNNEKNTEKRLSEIYIDEFFFYFVIIKWKKHQIKKTPERPDRKRQRPKNLDNFVLGDDNVLGDNVSKKKQKRVFEMTSNDTRIPKDIESVIIKSSVTNIGKDAFYKCTSLTSVEFESPSRVTNIGNFAFYGCTSLTSVEIPSSVTNIGNLAFKDCTGLTSVVIPDGVTSIGNVAFEGCTDLASVEIPSSVTNIGEFAF